jgi:signal transduction histidine kinase
MWTLLDRLRPPSPGRPARARLVAAAFGLALPAALATVLLFGEGGAEEAALALVCVLVCVAVPGIAIGVGIERLATGLLLAFATLAAAAFSLRSPAAEGAVWVALLPLVGGFLLGARGAVVSGLVALLHLGVLVRLHASPPPAVLHAAGATLAAAILALSWERLVDRQARAVQDSARGLEALAERVAAGVIAVVDGQIAWANPTAGEVLGRPMGALLGQPLSTILPEAGAARPGHPLALAVGAGPDAHLVDLHVGEIPFAGRPATLVTLIDQTGRRREEEERLRLHTQLQESQKLELVGRLAAGVAHDFNNLLVSMVSNATLLAEEPALSEDGTEMVQELREASGQAAALVRQLLSFSGRGALAEASVEVGPLAQEVCGLWRSRCEGAGVALEIDAPRAGAAVIADPGQVRQVVMNLLTNALDAVPPDAGHIAVRVSTVDADAALLAGSRIGPPPAPGEYVEIAVQDDGCGITPADLARIFQPFFTTKARGHGIGLAAVQGILVRARGALLVETAPGEGTVMRALLPLAAPEDDAGQPENGAGRRVLVIDDEPSVRRQLVRVLERDGYAVGEAGGVAEGVTRIAEGEWDLILVDHLMPDGTGDDIATALHLRDDPTPLVLCSGTLHRLDPGADRAFAALIHKPFLPRELRETCRRVVRGALPAEDAVG